MIRRNVASQLIAFPELSLKADNSVVTSGATIRVKKDASATAAGSGTLAHDEDGIWNYTPTQGETDCAILKLYLKATGAQTIVLNIVTTGLDTALATQPVNVTQFGGTNGTFNSGVPTAALDSTATAALVDLIWDEATSGHTTAGTYGGRIVRATNSNTEVQITGSNHIAADIHNLQSGVITAGDFAANSITASALATDAVTEIQSGLATAAALATESTKINRIEAVATGTVTGAGTSTEVFVGPSATLTITVDSSGNRSAVVVT